MIDVALERARDAAKDDVRRRLNDERPFKIVSVLTQELPEGMHPRDICHPQQPDEISSAAENRSLIFMPKCIARVA